MAEDETEVFIENARKRNKSVQELLNLIGKKHSRELSNNYEHNVKAKIEYFFKNSNGKINKILQDAKTKLSKLEQCNEVSIEEFQKCLKETIDVLQELEKHEKEVNNKTAEVSEIIENIIDEKGVIDTLQQQMKELREDIKRYEH